MRRFLILIFLVSFFQLGYGQENSFRKNTISFESGIFSRGRLGLSYSRKFLKREKIFLSSDIFAGIGGSGYYYGLGFNLNIGKKLVVFVVGVDGKFCEFSWSESLFTDPYDFKGLTYNPYIGLSLFGKEGFTVKIRAGVVPIYEYGYHQHAWFLPTCGVSIGHSF